MGTQAREAEAARVEQAARERREAGPADREPPVKTFIVLMNFPPQWWNVHSTAPPLYLLGWRFVYVAPGHVGACSSVHRDSHPPVQVP